MSEFQKTFYVVQTSKNPIGYFGYRRWNEKLDNAFFFRDENEAREWTRKTGLSKNMKEGWEIIPVNMKGELKID